MEEEPVTIIDRDVLKVLSVDTRMDILKILSEGSRTPSDISKKLNKSDATIVEHLDTMMKAGLVKKVEQPGKKWVFYTLTDRGKGILSSKSRRLIIILSTSLLALFGGMLTYLQTYNQSTQYAATGEAAPQVLYKAVNQTVAQQLLQYQPILLYISLILISVGALGLVFYSFQKIKSRGWKYE